MRILLSAILLFSFVNAKTLVDGISFFVNDEPVTLYELYNTMRVEKVEREKAMEVVIREKLHDVSYKKYDIFIDDYDVDMRAKEVASANNITLFQLKDALAAKGVTWDSYFDNLKREMKKDKLYKKIVSSKLRIADDKELKEYYEKHKEEFSIPSQIETTKYFSKSEDAIKEKQNNPMYQSNLVASEKEVIETKSISPSLRDLFMQTKEGSFTRILPAGDLFVTFYVVKKVGDEIEDFGNVKEMIFSKIMQNREDELIKEHFDRLRATAKVRVLRLE